MTVCTPKRDRLTRMGWAATMATCIALTGSVAAIPASAAPAPPNFLLVGGTGSGDLAVFSESPDGRLTEVPGSPFPTGGVGTLSVEVTPNAQFAYVSHAVTGSIHGFRIGSNGALTEIPGAQLDLGSPAVTAAVSPDGEYLYATIGGIRNEVRSYAISDSGTLTPSAAEPAVVPGISALSQPVVTPDGSNLYVSSFVSNTVTSFSVGPNGQLTQLGEPLPTGKQPALPSITPDGRFLYITNEQSSTVSGFAIGDDGQLAEAPG